MGTRGQEKVSVGDMLTGASTRKRTRCYQLLCPLVWIYSKLVDQSIDSESLLTFCVNCRQCSRENQELIENDHQVESQERQVDWCDNGKCDLV